MKQRCALITGASGGIGSALVAKYTYAGFHVVGLDIAGSSGPNFSFVDLDLDLMCTDSSYRTLVFSRIDELISQYSLTVLINNAAKQVVRPMQEISAGDWFAVMNVNVTAPFLLIQKFMSVLEKENGSVVNISSIHSTLTKPGFVAYATSKGALATLTRALAVECGEKVRVNAISPAAISTPMLRDGFRNEPEKLADLEAFHPVKRIGTPEEIADLAFFLTQSNNKFLNGSVVSIDGGISGRLYDPA